MTSTYSDRIKGIATSVAVKAPCRMATTANITLSGLQTIDGVAQVAEDRVLVKNQTNTVENGIYAAAVSAWARTEDFNDDRDVVTGTEVIVTAGSTQASKRFRVSSANPILPGSSALTFSLVDIQAQDALLQSISTLGITADKFIYGTGIDTVAIGDITAAARSILDDATVGAILATLGGQPLDADLTDIAAIADVQGDIIIRGASGWQRLAKGTTAQILAMNSTDPEWVSGNIGVGQTWQDVSASRTHSTSYQNTTGRPIFVAIVGGASPATAVQVSSDNATWIQVGLFGSQGTGSSFIVPIDWYYKIVATATINEWAELR